MVDQDALYNALKSNQIFAAGLDTVTPEPIDKDHPLVGLPNCCKYLIFKAVIVSLYVFECCFLALLCRHYVVTLYITVIFALLSTSLISILCSNDLF